MGCSSIYKNIFHHSYRIVIGAHVVISCYISTCGGIATFIMVYHPNCTSNPAISCSPSASLLIKSFGLVFFPAWHFNLSRTWQLHQTNINDSYPSEGPLVIKQVDRLYPSLDLPRLADRSGGPSCRQKKQKNNGTKSKGSSLPARSNTCTSTSWSRKST